MQPSQVKDFFPSVEQSIDNAAELCQITNDVPDDVREHLSELERESNRARRILEDVGSGTDRQAARDHDPRKRVPTPRAAAVVAPPRAPPDDEGLAATGAGVSGAGAATGKLPPGKPPAAQAASGRHSSSNGTDRMNATLDMLGDVRSVPGRRILARHPGANTAAGMLLASAAIFHQKIDPSPGKASP